MVWYHLQRKMATHSTKGRTSTSVVVTTGMHPAARESYIRRLEAVSPLGQKQNLQTTKTKRQRIGRDTAAKVSCLSVGYVPARRTCFARLPRKNVQRVSPIPHTFSSCTALRFGHEYFSVSLAVYDVVFIRDARYPGSRLLPTGDYPKSAFLVTYR